MMINQILQNNFWFSILFGQALRVLKKHQMASAVMDCGRILLQDVYDAQLQISRVANKAVGVRHSGKV